MSLDPLNTRKVNQQIVVRRSTCSPRVRKIRGKFNRTTVPHRVAGSVSSLRREGDTSLQRGKRHIPCSAVLFEVRYARQLTCARAQPLLPKSYCRLGEGSGAQTHRPL